MNSRNLSRVAGAAFSGSFSAREGVGGLRWGLLALALLAVVALPLLFGTGTAQAQQTTPVDYDTDDDGLIEVDSLAKLNAIRWDLNGDGKVAAGNQSNYDAAFPNAAAGLGCGDMDHDGDTATPDQPVCQGYELTANLTFDEDGDGDVDSDDATYWNGGAGWEPVGLVNPDGLNTLGFAATFDGNDNTIDYLFINRPREKYGKKRFGWIGLFRSIDHTGAVRNLNLTNVDVSGGKMTGSLAASIYGSVSGVSGSGDVSGDQLTGGIAGRAGCKNCQNALIASSSFAGTVTSDERAIGGLVGGSRARIVDSSSSATVISNFFYIGGLVGRMYSGSIVSSHASGNVTGMSTVGGLVGRMYSGSIVSSHASGNVTGRRWAGGLLGDIFRPGGLLRNIEGGSVVEHSYATGNVAGHWSGGFMGANNGEVRHSYATGSVAARHGTSGGFVGYNNSHGVITASYATGPVNAYLAGGFAGYNSYGLIQDSYASGQVTGERYAGGFIGSNTWSGKVRRSYALSEVGLIAKPLPGNRTGGFAALNHPSAKVTDSYWDTTVSRQSASAGGTGYTTAELQAPTGYTGIYAPWHVDVDNADEDDDDQTGKDVLWDFGTASQYPALIADFDGDGTATSCEFGGQGRCAASASATGASEQRGARATNRPPAYADNALSRSVAENTAAGTNIGNPITATDPDGDTLTYALGGADADHFAIDAASGQLSTRGALDHESEDSYAVSVTARDPDGLSASVTVTITVTDVADTPPGQPAPPTFTNIAETSFRIVWTAPTAGSSAITGYGIQYKLSSESDDAYADVSPTPSGTTLGYNVVSSQGQNITPATSYDVRVRAQNAEGWGQWSEAGTVTTAGTPPPPPNRAPSYADSALSLSVAENTAAGTNIGNPITATDPDGDALTYALGGVGAGHFAIDGATGQLKTKGALDYESDASYAVTVTATDPDGLSASVAVTITVTDVADTPPGKPAAPTFTSVQETRFRVVWMAPAAGSSAVTGYGIQYKLSSEPDDAYADVSPTPSGTTLGYNVVSGQGQNITPATSYDVRVRAQNAEGWGQWTEAGTVTTAGTPPPPPNRAPAFADSALALRVAENTAAGTVIGAPITATDPDGDALTYALGGADADHFDMDAASGQLKTKGALDYESEDSYAVTVTATDPDGLSASVAVTITVTDVADTPPGQPAPPTFTNIQETRFRILWAAPTPGSSPRDAVGLQYKLTSASDEAWADVKPAPGTGRRGFNLTNRGGQHVTAGTSYDVRVREGNAQGWGEWSDAGTVTTAGTAQVQPAQPAAPTFTEVQETRFRILWQAPTPGASPITGYGLQYKLSSASDEAWADVKPEPRGVRASGFNLTNRRGQSIAPGTSYDVRVRAQNAEGWGEWSEAGTVTTAGTAPAGS